MKRSLLGVLVSLALSATGGAAWADKYDDTIKVFRDAGESGRFFSQAYGYAVFPTIGKGGIGIGGAYGEGRVYAQGKPVGDSSVAQLTIGFQLGGQAYSMIVFLKDKRAFDEFTSGSFEFSAEAVTPCRVIVVRRSALLAAAGRDAELGSALWLHASRELQRMHEHLVLLGRKSAAERVEAFLRSTGQRLDSRTVVDIPMSRQDIADHLGLTIETVSRTMTQLRETGAIVLEGSRRIRIGQPFDA